LSGNPSSSPQPDDDNKWEDLPDGAPIDINAVLDGEELLHLSHAGGKLAEILESDLRKEQYVLATLML
jgi:hypothetical protein